MAYDGFYAGLSSRASVNEILNLALAAKGEVVEATKGATAARDAADVSATNAKASATTATANAASTASDKAAVKAYLDTAKRKFTIYAFERTLSVGQKAVAITPQYALTSQNPPVDWFGTASANSNGVLHAVIMNNGVPMETAADIRVINGYVSFTVRPHAIRNGDTLVITSTSGMISELSLTLRYDSEAF